MPNLNHPVVFSVSAGRVRTRRWLQIAIGLMGLWAILPIYFGQRVVVINTSPSVAPGLYMRSAIEPAVGQIVDFRIPQRAKHYVQDRTGQNCADWYILKPIAAGPGDRVDTTGSWLIINGHAIAPMPPNTDSVGRPLPIWREKRRLGSDEYFVFSDRIPNSFDSRCYGPISRAQIETVRRPLITW
jgi:conjugative transfer signal peptidase TraF